MLKSVINTRQSQLKEEALAVLTTTRPSRHDSNYSLEGSWRPPGGTGGSAAVSPWGRGEDLWGHWPCRESGWGEARQNSPFSGTSPPNGPLSPPRHPHGLAYGHLLFSSLSRKSHQTHRAMGTGYLLTHSSGLTPSCFPHSEMDTRAAGLGTKANK